MVKETAGFLFALDRLDRNRQSALCSIHDRVSALIVKDRHAPKTYILPHVKLIYTDISSKLFVIFHLPSAPVHLQENILAV